MSLFNVAVLRKQQTVLELRERGIASEKLLKSAPTLNIGGGIDVEYPLCIGARKIHLVDPILKMEPSVFNLLRQKISRISKGQFAESSGTFTFLFDFGHGKEEVTVVADPRAYVKVGTEIGDVERFTPLEAPGALIAFQGPDPSSDRDVLEKLASGGIVLSNRMPGSFFSEFLDSKTDLRETYSELPPGERRRLLSEFYSSKGFESFILDCFGDEEGQTLLRKR